TTAVSSKRAPTRRCCRRAACMPTCGPASRAGSWGRQWRRRSRPFAGWGGGASQSASLAHVPSQEVDELVDRETRLVDDAAQRTLGDILAAMIRDDGPASRIGGMLKDAVTALRPNLHQAGTFESAHDLGRPERGQPPRHAAGTRTV